MLQGKLISVMVGAVAALSVASTASAQERRDDGYFRGHVRAPQRALELTPGLAYAEPFGDVAKGADVRDFARSAIAPSLGIAYRLTPRVAIGMTGMYSEFSSGKDVTNGVSSRAGGRAVGAGPDLTVHFNPYERVDPFVRVGFGYRAMWELRDGAGNDFVRHGFELARLSLGLDMRVSEDVAIAPVIGGSSNLYLWQSRDSGGSTTIADPRVNIMATAGLEARFDIGGRRVARGRTAVTEPYVQNTTTTSATVPATSVPTTSSNTSAP